MPVSNAGSRTQSLSGTRLTILYVGVLPPDHGGGGAGVVGGQILTGLAELGHKIVAIAPASEETIASGDAFARAHPEISVIRFPVKTFPVPYFETDDPASAESERLEGEGIRRGFDAALAIAHLDILIIGRPLFLWHVAELARTNRLPYIVLVHDNSVVSRIAHSYPAPIREKLLHGLRQAAGVIAVAHHLADEMRPLGFANLRVIPNAVDPRKFSSCPKDPALRAELGLDPNHPIVLHASNLRQPKRALDVVESAQEVLRHRGEVTYLVAGEGPDRAAMEELCKARGLAPHFRFAGWVAHERMPDLINLADVVLLPSEREGLALLYLETQACGKVLVASDIPAAKEVIVDGETGLLFRCGDIADLTAKTLMALNDSELRRGIGGRARQAILSGAWENFIASYETILLKAAANGS